MRKEILLQLFAVLISTLSFAQSGPAYTLGIPGGDYINLQKYWWYRYRLVNDFMKVGPQCGESIPAQRRDKDNNRLEWGDATIDLGNYISMLATEHRMLSNNGIDVSRTQLELYYALNAFDRLDRYAEAYCYDIDETYACNPQAAISEFRDNLNGFFIRDDVPFTSFGATNYIHFNRPGIIPLFPVSSGLVDGSFNGRTHVPYLAVARWRSDERRVPTEESMDQNVQMAMGMALASKLTSGKFYSGKNLGQTAAEHLQHMTNFIDEGGWKIVNPVTGKCVYGIDPPEFGKSINCFDGGAICVLVAQGMAEATKKWGTSPSSFLLHAAKYKGLWDRQQWNTIHKDLGFWGTYAALADNWFYSAYIGPYPVGLKNNTWTRMKQFATAKDNGNPHLPYLYRVMHGKGEPFRVLETVQLLDAAPGCGIHNYRGDYCNMLNRYGIFEHNPPVAKHWSGPDLIHEWYHRKEGKTEYRDHNGLDYMVMFNLFNLQLDHTNDYLRYFFNSYYKENFNETYPGISPLLPGTAIGNHTNKLKLNFLQYLSAINKIEPEGNLTFRGAKVIDLLPGFETMESSSFLAYVQDYTIGCGSEPTDGESGPQPGIPSDHYVYAEITGPKNVWIPSSGIQQGQGSGDTTIALDFPPGGVNYNPDTTIFNIPDTPATCAEERAYFDSLAAEIYASGDSELIAYLDTFIIPNTHFPACDSTGSGSNPDVTTKMLAQQAAESSSFNIYPNPNNGQFTVACSVTGDYELSLWNPVGIQVYRTRIYRRRSELIQTEGLPPGIYTAILTRLDGSGKRQIRKLTITQ